MGLCRRRFLHLAAGAAVLPAASRIARAQPYPSRPVKIIVGQAAGSASDLVARVIAQFLSEKLGQQFLVEVRPGAAGNIATEAVTHMPPDGYTLLLVNSQNAIQRRALREAQLRLCPRHHAGREGRERSAGHGGPPLCASQDHSRVNRLREG